MGPGVIGSGIYLPQTVVRNEAFDPRKLNYRELLTKCTLNEWIKTRYGVAERRVAHLSERPSDMATLAVHDALANCGLKPSDLDFLILNTATGDHVQPTTATFVQRNLGMRPNTFALEINLPCSGPIFGLVTAIQFLRGGQYRFGAVVGVDKMSAITNPSDFRSATLFGDAAGAFIVGQEAPYAMGAHYLASRGETGSEDNFGFYVRSFGTSQSTHQPTMGLSTNHLQMNRKVVEQFVHEAIQDIINNLPPPQGGYGLVVPSQAARPLLEKAFKSAGIDNTPIEFSLEKFGNTSSASVFLTFHMAKTNTLPSRSQLLLTGVGSGLNWGGVVLTKL